MRFIYIKLVNYIGIYNGLGLNELYIDFSKSKHKMIIIKGDNGSGKSTLFKALNPLPDSNESFIPNMNASKEIGVSDNGVMYILKFIHDVKSNGDRATTKAYIVKILPNGMENNMNPNGNVSSFKDILYEEFKLDSNFVTLSQLSNDDKGLADKRPAERKKFVNNIIESLETYNSIYKTLSKKSSIFKSMINSITTKLNSIGNTSILQSRLVDIENKSKILDKQKDDMINIKANAKATINILDPDNSIQNKYTLLSSQLNELLANTSNLDLDIKKLVSKKIPIDKDEIERELKVTRDLLIDTGIQIQIIKNDISTSLAAREEDSNKLRAKNDKLKSLEDTESISLIKNNIKTLNEKISYCEDIFNKIGVNDATKISKDEYITALNILKDIKYTIDSFKSDTDYYLLEKALEYVSNGEYPDVKSLNINLIDLKNKDTEYSNKIIEISNRDKILSQLKQRPKSCKRDDCGFVNAILDSIKEMPTDSLDDVQSLYTSNLSEIKTLEKTIFDLTIITEYINKIKLIIRTINTNKGLLQKFNTGILYIDNLEIFRKFLNGESFKYIDELYSYMNYANLFEEYKIYQEQLSVYKGKLDIYKSKEIIINEIIKDIDDLNTSLNDISNKISESNENLKKLEREQIMLSSKEGYLNMAYDTINNKCEFDNSIITIKNEMNKLYDNMSEIQKAMETIDDITEKEIILKDNINQLSIEKEKINHALQLYDEYVREMQEYNQKYNMIETIKYYSSPTTGIQLVFMELYMSKIISLANQLLSYLFEGRFVIQPFVITDTDFRIPVLGNGYQNDDVTSLSSGEKAMISMIISISMLHQSSSKYNILKLDEIDAPLDTANRTMFLIVLEQLMDILQSEQCIMISHNSEINTDNTDLIILKNTSGEVYTGNILYKYN